MINNVTEQSSSSFTHPPDIETESSAQTEVLEKIIHDPSYLPSHEDLNFALGVDSDQLMEQLVKWHEIFADNKTFELLNEEFIDAFTNYLVLRAAELPRNSQKPFIVLEIGAGNGRLSYFLQQKLREKGVEDIHIVASDSGEWQIEPMFPVEQISHEEALAVYEPQIVVFSWMPYGYDCTDAFRVVPSVQEYVLIGPPDGKACGDEWRTWGIDVRAESPASHQTPPYEADGFERVDLPEVSATQIGKEDTPGKYKTSKTVSFRRVE